VAGVVHTLDIPALVEREAIFNNNQRSTKFVKHMGCGFMGMECSVRSRPCCSIVALLFAAMHADDTNERQLQQHC
jgi:hypothetical protein